MTAQNQRSNSYSLNKPLTYIFLCYGWGVSAADGRAAACGPPSMSVYRNSPDIPAPASSAS